MPEEKCNFEIVSIPVKGNCIAVETVMDNGSDLGRRFIFEDGTWVELRDFHSQDCCESVYADWEYMDHMLPELTRGDTYVGMTIKGVPDMGLLLCFVEDYGLGTKLFLPCYNSQNGYYSSNLMLLVRSHLDENGQEFDITDYEEDHID